MKKIFLFFILFCTAAFSDTLWSNEPGHFSMDLSSKKILVNNAEDYFYSWFSLPNSTHFQVVKESDDRFGNHHCSYQQYIDGVPVEGCLIMIHSKDGYILSADGCVLEQTQEDNIGSVSVSYANAIQKVRKNDTVVNSDIVIVPINKDTSVVYRKAYKILSEDGMSYQYVDVETGEIIKKLSTVYDTDVKGTVSTAYNGTQDVTMWLEDGYYYLSESGRKIKTYNYTEGDEGAFIFYGSSNNMASDYITSVAITFANSSLWYDWFDEKPDLFIQIYDAKNQLVYTSPVIEDIIPSSNTPVVFNPMFPLNSTSYTILILDKDITSSDHCGTISLDNVSAGTYTWDGNNTAGVIRIQKNPAYDAHWGMEKTIDFYRTILFRKGFRGNSTEDIVFQMLNPPGYKYDNAAAVSSAPQPFMVYGMGDGINYKPFVALDIMAHEYTHLVTAFNGNGGLNYESESGALNESFSDIMAIAVEYYAKKTCDWTIGEDIEIKYSNMRSLSNPFYSLDGYNPQPMEYKSKYWKSTANPNENNDHGGVHTNSGVQNYWFYLLSEGLTKKFGGGLFQSIGIDKAIQIAYQNLTHHLTPSATYMDARNGSLLSAAEIYGANSAEYKAVMNAWYIVGIGDMYKDYTLPSGKYFIAAWDVKDEDDWALSSKLTTTSPKRFIAEPFDFDFDFIPRTLVWNVTKNADGTYTFENNGKYMSWTSGNSVEMSSIPKKLNVTYDEDYGGFVISFKASSNETRTLSYVNDNGSRHFAFYGISSLNHFFIIEDVDDDDIEPIKPPSSIEDDIHKQNNTNKATKCIIDGQLFILRDGHRYTVTGAKVE